MSRSILSILFLLLSPIAQTAQAEEQPHYNLVSLQAEVSREVSNDKVLATLAIELQGDDPAQLADTINKGMAWALKQTQQYANVKVESGSYRTFPIYDRSELKGWRASQELKLSSSETTSLSALVGVLQSRLQVKSMNFQVSANKRRAVENELIKEALTAFSARAEIVLDTLQARGYRIVNLNVSTTGSPPVPVYRADMAVMRATVATPAMAAGTTQVSVSVAGSVQLER